MKKIILLAFLILSIGVKAQTICDSIVPSFTKTYLGVNKFSFNASYTYIGTTDTVYADSMTYSWNFGDTGTSNIKSPSYIFDSGKYEVCLQITYKALGVTCVKTFCDSVKLGSVCDSITPISYTYTNSGSTFSFTGTSITYSGFGSIDTDSILYYWDFDDGNSSTVIAPSNVFGSGDYVVCFQNIYNTTREVCSQMYCDTIKIPSVCDSLTATYSNLIVAANTHQFNSSYSLSSGGTLDTNNISYSWTFGDGGTSNLKAPLHTFDPGTYEVCLDFTYQEIGTVCTQNICDTITISAVCDTLSPSFTVNYTSVNTYNLQPSYSYTGSNIIDSNLISYYWNFGDGDTSILKSPTHTYGSGTYTICMDFTYEVQGEICTKTMCDTITVYSICDSITTSFTSNTSGLNTLSFTPSYNYAGFGSLDTNNITYTWSFGDSVSITQKNPTHSYVNSGSYTVCLELQYQTPQGTCSVTTCNTVVVSSVCDSITTSFSPTYRYVNTFIFNPFVTYTGPGTLDTNNSNYSWSFGDGATSNLETPIHTFTPGQHLVCLQYNYQLSGVTCIHTVCDTISTTVVVSIDELTAQDVSVYPNPAQDEINIVLNSTQILDGVSIKLIDVSGKVFYTEKINSTNTLVNVSGFEKGTYMLLLQTKKSIITKRIVVN